MAMAMATEMIQNASQDCLNFEHVLPSSFVASTPAVFPTVPYIVPSSRALPTQTSADFLQRHRIALPVTETFEDS